MLKNLFLFTLLFLFLEGFHPANAQKTKQGSTTKAKGDVKFLENISVEVAPSETTVQPAPNPKAFVYEAVATSNKKITPSAQNAAAALPIESAQALQFKYALLMDQEVEEIRNLSLFRLLDDWLGTRYRLGGTDKEGIDCSAFMQVLFTRLYGINLPRTAREQFTVSQKLSRAELKEGDLVFFNTIGGVSHVGMYIQNNKFVHASSGGVTISDLYEDYWLKKFIGVGRVDVSLLGGSASIKP
jgi:cell wall-associated NlpC family hydrolase